MALSRICIDTVSHTPSEPVSDGVGATRKAGVRRGDRVLVTGAGPIGLFAAQVARAFGAAKVTVTDVSDFRLDVARDLGLGADLLFIGAYPQLTACDCAPANRLLMRDRAQTVRQRAITSVLTLQTWPSWAPAGTKAGTRPHAPRQGPKTTA